MKKLPSFIFFTIIVFIVLFGCSRKEDADIVVNVQSKDPTDTQIEHLEKMFTFIDNLQKKKASDIKIAIKGLNNKEVISTLNYNGKIITFTNNYPDFGTRIGKYKCKSIEAGNMFITATGCKGDEQDLVVLMTTTSNMREAKSKQ